MRRQEGRVVWYRLANPATYQLIDQVGIGVLEELRSLPHGAAMPE